MQMLYPILTLSSLGLLFGLGLSVAAKKFCIATDPKLEKVFSLLPGANCGACGMPGCMGFAQALIKGTCTIDKCPVSEEDARKKIAQLLGIKVEEKVKQIAILHCGGGNRVKDKFGYTGIRNCIVASQLQKGPKACVYGCIGYGACVMVCPFGAISMGEDDLPIIDEEKCTACGKCVEACPNKLFSLADITKKYVVQCKSLDMGKKVMEVCKVGCIACRKCERVCPVQAIKVINNLAVIDYNICNNNGKCMEVCPTKCIKKK